MSVYVVLAAAGSGTRMKSEMNKILMPVCGSPVLRRSIRLFEGVADNMVIVYREPEFEAVKSIADEAGVSFPLSFVPGGDTRQSSILNGLKTLDARENDLILVHDAARCLTPRSVIMNVIHSCHANGSGIPGIPVVSTVKYAAADKSVFSTAERKNLFEIQTPQGFYFGNLLRAYNRAEKDHFSATDDAAVMEHAGMSVYITEGSRMNIKITEKEDLQYAEAILSVKQSEFRIGTGYDVHRLVKGRHLILCGIRIPHSLGLLGHSDADVGLHALMDAMLGAVSLGDIGKHFPDSSDEYLDISSLLLLRKTYEKVMDAGYKLVNADITLVAQKPKIGPYIPEMIQMISSTLDCRTDQISIKATTTEMLGFEGREEGISAQAVCMLRRFVY